MVMAMSAEFGLPVIYRSKYRSSGVAASRQAAQRCGGPALLIVHTRPGHSHRGRPPAKAVSGAASGLAFTASAAGTARAR
jgi:hypothetical protein